jgi:UDP-N-acetyl-D-mannosaminuronate dehydrogenase
MGLGCHEMYSMICNVYFGKLLNKEHQLGVKHQKLQEVEKTLDIVVLNTLQQSYKSQRSNQIQKKIQSTRCTP